jgi:hypothetical protein
MFQQMQTFCLQTASEKSSPVKPSVTFASHEGEQYEGHVFTHGRYAEATISAADLVCFFFRFVFFFSNENQKQVDESAVAKVAQLHQQNRRRYAYLAANAYRAGDSQAAKKFSQVCSNRVLLCCVVKMCFCLKQTACGERRAAAGSLERANHRQNASC